jgi:hypothetical protein
VKSKVSVGPKARSEDLLVREVRNETLVYDLKRDKAHCLNRTASMIWKRCNGQRTVNDLRKVLTKDFETPVNRQVIELGLHKLQQLHLIGRPSSGSTWSTRRSRREVMKKLGGAALFVLPMVTTIVAPTAVMAATCPAPMITDAQCDAPTVGCCCQNAKRCRQTGVTFHCNGADCP